MSVTIRQVSTFCRIASLMALTVTYSCSNAAFKGDGSLGQKKNGASDDVKIKTSEARKSEDPTPNVDIEQVPGGLADGHFDLDTSLKVYPANQGTTNFHVHEYDDRFNVTGVDFFALLDKGLNEIQTSIPADKKFVIVVKNADLSTGAILQTNDKQIKAQTYQKDFSSKVLGSTQAPIWSIGGVAGSERLSKLKMVFSKDAITQGGLVPSSTECVRKNTPGKNGEYRSGALTIQALDLDALKADFDAQVESSTGLLWEATIFWHRDSKC